MNVFPLDLVLTIAVASATIFFGFLPTRDIPSFFFERQTIPAGVAWLVVALIVPFDIFHYFFLNAFLCFFASWKFHHGHTFAGKMGMNVASGLGISVGVMLILAVTPRAYPPEWSQTAHALLLASIYLGGAVPGLAYASYALIKEPTASSGVMNNLVQRSVRLLMVLPLARFIVLLAGSLLLPGMAFHSVHNAAENAFQSTFFLIDHPVEFKVAIGLNGAILPFLAFLAWRALRSGRQTLASRLLIAICLAGLAGETFIRLYLG